MGFRNIFRNIQEYTDKDINSNSEEIEFKIIGLVHKVRSLSHDVLWKCKDSLYRNEAKDTDFARFESVNRENDQIVMSHFPELNDIFIRTWTVLNSFDQTIKEVIAYTVFNQDNKELSLFDSNTNVDKSRHLSEFYFMKKMVFLFMDVINHNINSLGFLSRRSNKELMRFCEVFEHDILRIGMKRGLRLHRIFDIFMDMKSERFFKFHPKEMMMYSEEFERQLERLGRNTFKALDKINYRL